MIQPDRLKELIEQGATIYELKEKHLLEYGFENVDFRAGYNVSGIYLTFGKDDPTIIAMIENLFETEEDAEWFLEFGNIVREEKLSLPSWEEFCKLDYEFVFYDRNYNKFSMYLTIEKEICIWNWNIETTKVKFLKPTTKKNYIDACRLCKKIFLGETR